MILQVGIFVLAVLLIMAIGNFVLGAMRGASPGIMLLGILVTCFIVALLIVFVAGCELDSEPFQLSTRQRVDPCCFEHGGTCGWLGAKVIPICCDNHLARECTQLPAAAGGPP